VLNQIKATTVPLQWFEAPLTDKAGSVSTKNAASMVNGSQSAQAFMSAVQAAQTG